MAYQERQALLSDLILYLSRITPEDLENNSIIEIIDRFFAVCEESAQLELTLQLDLFQII